MILTTVRMVFPTVRMSLDTQPDYTDSFPLPAPDQNALWRYRTIYIKNDTTVGQWSDVAEVALKGQL